LKSEKLEFRFFTGPCNHLGISSVNVQNDPFVAVLYKNHPLAKNPPVTLEELSNDSFILGSSDGWHNYLEHLLRICEKAGFTPNIVQQAFNSDGIFGLIACEMGITIHSGTTFAYRKEDLVVVPIKMLMKHYLP
jgi:DNA-binding transcriptional LysR family regulator